MAMASLPGRTERSPHSPSSRHHPIPSGYAKHESFPNPYRSPNPASHAARGGVEPQRLPSLNLVFNPGSALGPPAVPLASIATADTHPGTTSSSRDRSFSTSSSASFPARVISPQEAALYSYPPRPQSLPRRSNSSPHIHSLSATDVRRAHPYRPPPNRPATAYPTLGPTGAVAQRTSPVFSVPPPRPSRIPPPRPLQSSGSLQRDLLPSPLPRSETRTVPTQAAKSARSTSSSSLSPEAIIDGQSSRRRGRTATACKFCQSRKQRCSGGNPCENCASHGVASSCHYPVQHDHIWSQQVARHSPSSSSTSKRPSPRDTSQRSIKSQSKSKRPRSHSVIDTKPKLDVDRSAILEPNPRRMPAGLVSVPDHFHSRSVALFETRSAKESSFPIITISERGGVGAGVQVGFPAPQPTSGSLTPGSGMAPTPFTSPPFATPSESMRPARTPAPILTFAQLQQDTKPHLAHPDRRRPNSHTSQHQHSTANHRATTTASGPPPPADSRSPPTSDTDVPELVGSRHTTADSATSGPDELMEEVQAPGGGPTGSVNDGYLGSSHFGPLSAAKFLSGNLSVPIYALDHPRPRGPSHLDLAKEYTLPTQLRRILPHFPDRASADRYVKCFFERYNDHVDFLHQPDFEKIYESFWRVNSQHSSIDDFDLRYMALILVVLAFGVLLDHPNPANTVSTAALRRVAANDPRARQELEQLLSASRALGGTLGDRIELSLKWSWAAKRALVEASGFYGDSMETVGALGLLSLYLITCRRVTEGWKTIGEAIRAAEGLGMHLDGARWSNITLKEAEIRRRMWAQLYIIDRSVSIFLGRPVGMLDDTFNTAEPSNITDSELAAVPPNSQCDRRSNVGSCTNPFSQICQPLDQPTKSTFLILHFRLAKIIGIVQSRCHGLRERRLADVYKCEELFKQFETCLPRHFRLDEEQVDTSLDHLPGFEWIRFQRLSLHSKYHLARVALHRPFVTLFSVPETDASRRACILSSLADLRLRTTTELNDPLDRFKWLTVASGFQAATVIGCYCISLQQHHKLPRKDPRLNDVEPMLALLESYIAMEEKTTRQDEQLFVELQVLRICVDYIRNPSKLVRSRESSRQRGGARGRSVSGPVARSTSSGARAQAQRIKNPSPPIRNLPVQQPIPPPAGTGEAMSPPHPSLAAILNDPVLIPTPVNSHTAIMGDYPSDSGSFPAGGSDNTPRGPNATLTVAFSRTQSQSPSLGYLPIHHTGWQNQSQPQLETAPSWAGLGLYDSSAHPSDPTGPGGMMPMVLDPGLWDTFFLNMPIWSNTERGMDFVGMGLDPELDTDVGRTMDPVSGMGVAGEGTGFIVNDQQVDMSGQQGQGEVPGQAYGAFLPQGGLGPG